MIFGVKHLACQFLQLRGGCNCYYPVIAKIQSREIEVEGLCFLTLAY